MVAMGVAPWGVVRNRHNLINPKVGPRVLEKEGAGGRESHIRGRRGLGVWILDLREGALGGSGSWV